MFLFQWYTDTKQLKNTIWREIEYLNFSVTIMFVSKFFPSLHGFSSDIELLDYWSKLEKIAILVASFSYTKIYVLGLSFSDGQV